METNTQREAAIKWWNELPFYSSNTNKSKKHYFDNYKANVYTVARDYTELTGREIQMIWAVETSQIENEVFETNTSTNTVKEVVDERIKRFQNQMDAYDNEHANGGDIQNIKESYYYKGRRDEAIWQKEQDEARYKALKESHDNAIQVLESMFNATKDIHISKAQTKLIMAFNKIYKKAQEIITKAKKF